MPDARTVADDIVGTDDMDTVARKQAAMSILFDVLHGLSIERARQQRELSPGVPAKARSYRDIEEQAPSILDESYREKCAALDFACPKDRLYTRKRCYSDSERFRRDLLTGYLRPRLMQSSTVRTYIADGTAPPQQRAWFERIFSATAGCSGLDLTNRFPTLPRGCKPAVRANAATITAGAAGARGLFGGYDTIEEAAEAAAENVRLLSDDTLQRVEFGTNLFRDDKEPPRYYFSPVVRGKPDWEMPVLTGEDYARSEGWGAVSRCGELSHITRVGTVHSHPFSLGLPNPFSAADFNQAIRPLPDYPKFRFEKIFLVARNGCLYRFQPLSTYSVVDADDDDGLLLDYGIFDDDDGEGDGLWTDYFGFFDDDDDDDVGSIAVYRDNTEGKCRSDTDYARGR